MSGFVCYNERNGMNKARCGKLIWDLYCAEGAVKKNVGFWPAMLACVMLILSGMLSNVRIIGTDDGLYYKLQSKAEILDFAGVSGEDLRLLDGALADYLAGRRETLADIEVAVFGEMQPAFNERELTHMADCRALFRLAGTLEIALAVLAVPAVGFGWWLTERKRWFCLGVFAGALAVAALLGGFALWAVNDFGAAFEFFHETLFTNDLWLLDPRTDLLIRICPTSMFMAMGARIAVQCAVTLMLAPLMATAFAALHLVYNRFRRKAAKA